MVAGVYRADVGTFLWLKRRSAPPLGKGSPMLLHDLLQQFDPSLSVAGIKNVDILGIADDSRQVKAGDLFVARSGAKSDGRQFILDATARGAVAIVFEDSAVVRPLPLVIVRNIGPATSRLANLLVGEPSRAVQVVGVTGTNGKTTTAYLIRHLLASVKRRCGMIGTVEIDDGRCVREATMTTPGAVEMAYLLGSMRDSGCSACAMEVSSHALDQGRVAGVGFAGAAFTNLTGDHLDYHKTMENYAAAKSALFEGLDASAVAAVNVDDPWSDRMVKRCRGRIIGFGFAKDADYRAKDIGISAEGSQFVLVTPDREAEVKMALVGRHNIANALTAATLVGEVFGLNVHQIAAGLRDAGGAPGRLQPVRCGQPFTVLVDYAHTDDALENVLSALRPLNKGKLRVLFGCGGDRDATKRPRMAQVVAKFADAIYVTSDNPRTERPEAIIEQIVAGLPAGLRKEPGNRLVVEIDRGAAIRRIVGDAGAGDVVLLAGKGHENYQIVGVEKHHFDDVEEVTRALSGGIAV